MRKEIRMNENKGFSLVELIVVIAIMAVLVAVLAPSLLQYVERSRAQKDDSAMGEVANAIMLALSDQDVYDEVLSYSTYNNVSCYIDASKEADYATYKEETKAATDATKDTGKQQYLFSDDCRLADETEYYLAGNMRGVTITFIPNKNGQTSEFKMSDALVNAGLKNGSDSAPKRQVTEDGARGATAYVNGTPTANFTLGTMNPNGAKKEYHYLFNRVRSTIGDAVELTSQTYRNSEYTVFIRMGSTGGNAANAQDAVKVYGQWNGTNLIFTEDAGAGAGGGEG
jgi:prepilin-type N-terminal cleavage/methylation domain-containing protein